MLNTFKIAQRTPVPVSQGIQFIRIKEFEVLQALLECCEYAPEGALLATVVGLCDCSRTSVVDSLVSLTTLGLVKTEIKQKTRSKREVFNYSVDCEVISKLIEKLGNISFYGVEALERKYVCIAKHILDEGKPIRFNKNNIPAMNNTETRHAIRVGTSFVKSMKLHGKPYVIYYNTPRAREVALAWKEVTALIQASKEKTNGCEEATGQTQEAYLSDEQGSAVPAFAEETAD